MLKKCVKFKTSLKLSSFLTMKLIQPRNSTNKKWDKKRSSTRIKCTTKADDFPGKKRFRVQRRVIK